jgi:hypothetical protein
MRVALIWHRHVEVLLQAILMRSQNFEAANYAQGDCSQRRGYRCIADLRY